MKMLKVPKVRDKREAVFQAFDAHHVKVIEYKGGMNEFMQWTKEKLLKLWRESISQLLLNLF